MKQRALRLSQVALIAAALFALGGYAFVEARGVAFGGRKAPTRVTPEELRSSSTGSSTFLYWSHGLRGK